MTYYWEKKKKTTRFYLQYYFYACQLDSWNGRWNCHCWQQIRFISREINICIIIALQLNQGCSTLMQYNCINFLFTKTLTIQLQAEITQTSQTWYKLGEDLNISGSHSQVKITDRNKTTKLAIAFLDQCIQLPKREVSCTWSFPH